MDNGKKNFSGIYPHLAVTNRNGTECGIGAVARFGGKLYFVTYAASCARGGDDGLYIVDSELNMERYDGSLGGTDANRFIHTESGQLIIGCYFIDGEGNIRSLDPKCLIGRLTSTSYSLDEPEKYVYINTMENGIYKVNVETLEFETLRPDRFDLFTDEKGRMESASTQLPGEHAKGGYSAGGAYVTTNNGLGGALLEWCGEGDPSKRESWKVIDRNKYTEVITKDGICGNKDSDAPLWAVGWDEASVLLNVRTEEGWTRLRLPKASYTHDADNGWYTEWPRIRKVAGRYLFCMHGMFWEFPENFALGATCGLKPISRHLKMIVDFEDFDGQIVFACDDASVMENRLSGRSQSNLWFSDNEKIDSLSSPMGFGGCCVHSLFEIGDVTEPFYIGGFENAVIHISTSPTCYTSFYIEGSNTAQDDDFHKICDTGAVSTYTWRDLSECGYSWIRVRLTRNTSDCSVYFHLSNAPTENDEKLTRGLHRVGDKSDYNRGILYPIDSDELILGYKTEDGYFTWNGTDGIEKSDTAPAIFDSIMPSPDTVHLENSIVIVDHLGVKRHLPIAYNTEFSREIREVVTERNLLNVGGTVYELPRESSLGAMRMKPITSHGLEIYDFASYRGMLILSGVDGDAEGEHIISDGGVKLWAGCVDDLWKFGRPIGRGGATVGTLLYPNEAGEPFLFYGYQNRSVELSHDSTETVSFTIEADIMGDGTYVPYERIDVPAGATVCHKFPDVYEAHWMRVRIDKLARATALFEYK